jgi:acyl-CoA synthetase (AMP-forming)/AMP-acid ligase II
VHKLIKPVGDLGDSREVPAAFVVMRPAVDEQTARDLLDAHYLSELERWKRPRSYVLVDEVPRTPSGARCKAP